MAFIFSFPASWASLIHIFSSILHCDVSSVYGNWHIKTKGFLFHCFFCCHPCDRPQSVEVLLVQNHIFHSSSSCRECWTCGISCTKLHILAIHLDPNQRVYHFFHMDIILVSLTLLLYPLFSTSSISCIT